MAVNREKQLEDALVEVLRAIHTVSSAGGTGGAFNRHLIPQLKHSYLVRAALDKAQREAEEKL